MLDRNYSGLEQNNGLLERTKKSTEDRIRLCQRTALTVVIRAKLYLFQDRVQGNKDVVCLFEQVSIIAFSLRLQVFNVIVVRIFI